MANKKLDVQKLAEFAAAYRRGEERSEAEEIENTLKELENKAPVLLTSFISKIHSHLLIFQSFKLLSIAETDIIISLLFFLSKICLKFDIYLL